MLLYISLLLILLSIILIIYNWKLNNNAVFIGLFFSLIALYGLVHYFVIYGKSVFWLAIFYNHLSPFFLLAGPFLYFYVRGTLKDRQGLKAKDFVHFIPTIIHFVGILPYTFSSFYYKEKVAKAIIENMDNLKRINVNVLFNHQFSFIFRLLTLTFYLIYSFNLLSKFSKKYKKIQKTPQRQYVIINRWITILLCLVALLLVNYFILCYYFLSFEEIYLKNIVVIINSITGLSFVFLASGILFFPEVLYGLPNTKISKSKIKMIKNDKSQNENKHLPLLEESEDPFIILSERIKDYLDSEKPYLNSNFSVTQIAIKLDVPQNHILYCIHSVFNTKFSKLKTKLRVEQTKLLLKESVHSNITIDGIAQLAGFSSRSSFYIAFKDETGITPSDYLKTIIDNETIKE